MAFFRIRINCLDHYQATPTDFDPPLPILHATLPEHFTPGVPVIRVFGATDTGQKACAHIHGAFPYLYIEYDGILTQDAVRSYIHRLHLSIDHALAVSYRRKTGVKNVFVAHIALVKGVPFYGYHVGYSFYLKIYMFNPVYMIRLADLLRQGTIMSRSIQPYESHLQYLAQWMCDFNLYGCAYIECKDVRFRNPVPSFADQDADKHKWHDRRISPSLISNEASLPRQSHCSLEVDICVQDILNRLDIVPRLLHHDFIERNDPPASSEKLVHSMADLWRDETRRRRALQGASESSPFPPEVLVSVSADPRTSQSGGWIHEEEYAHQVRKIMEAERRDGGRIDASFDTFIEKAPFETEIKTALESVEDLFPENILNLPTAKEASETNVFILDANNKVAEVDELRVLSFVEEDFQYESDDDLEHGRQVSGNDNLCLPEGRVVDKDTVQSAVDSSPATRENTAEQSKDIGNPVLFGDAIGPTSSNEFELLGIRDRGDYSHVDEDTFIVPTEYASDLAQSTKRGSKPAATQFGLGPPAKRRKLLHDEQIADTGVMESTSAEQEGDKSPTTGSNHVHNNHDKIPPSLLTGIGMHYQPEISKRNFSLLTPSSQEGYIENDTNGNRTLLFPIVKDPHDPGTIARLSQRSISPTKGSQLSKVTSNSFQTTTGINSESSDIPAITPSSNHEVSLIPPASQITRCATQIRHVFEALGKKRLLYYRPDPPNRANCVFELRQANIPSIIYQDAYYSDERDVPDRPREYAGKEFKLESNTVPYLPDFDPSGTSLASYGEKVPVVIDKIAQEKLYQKQRRACDLRIWEIDQRPPMKSEVLAWLDGIKDDASLNGKSSHLENVDLPQIDSATQKNRHGFKYSQNHPSTSVKHETQYMSIMSLEIHISTRENLLPNPEHDEIGCIFWCIQSEEDSLEGSGISKCTRVGILLLSEDGLLNRTISQHTSVQVDSESNELDLINRLVDIVRDHDPDILTGYEVHNGSWGYVIERARFKYDYNLCEELSRMKAQSHGRHGKESDKWGYNHTSTIRVTGRHMINIWRAMRGELNLLQYTLENVVFHLLHRRIPHYPYKVLTKWYISVKPKELMKTISYYVTRVQLNLEILDENELIARTSEQARLLGVDFFSVFSRGSQFKVESLMFRIAKPENYLLPSPSRKQVGQQNALECLPLVMEPQSAFYNSPLLVLDFQSLYPSVMIAYNYCYSTYLGRVVSWRGQNKMGFKDYQRQQGILELFKDQINLAPNGIIYAKPGIRKSLLAKMLAEIIETRVMVKSGMKVNKEDKTLQRLLNNRQLALKLIANVTYGYTSASFSGRMPCSEIADSIVQTGRETLEKAIALIHSVRKWRAEVVYGDTDSLFVYLKGRTKDEAFDIGEEIAKTITDMNPRPVKLKFEKVYLPCVLLAKKRYVGFKYETRFQKFPDFDAKGIETVRRDGTPGEQKIEEKALKLLFRTADLSQVKSYFQEQCIKIMKGKVSIQDFCFAKEVKLGTYSGKGVPPPGALISTRRMLEDPRAEPQYGERVPYVVITGAPGARLIDRCVAPEVLLENDQNQLDAGYYILKNLIPPLERIFNLVGANVRQWYEEMPRFQRIRRIETGFLTSNKEFVFSKKTLESYMKSSSCLVCHAKHEKEAPLCSSCSENAQNSLLILRSRLNKADRDAVDLEKVCRSCAGLVWGEEIKCDSKDCPVFYTRVRHMAHLRHTKEVTQPTINSLERVASSDLDW